MCDCGVYSENANIIKKVLNDEPHVVNSVVVDLSPLMYAAIKNYFDCLNVILEFNLDINFRNKSGNTALLYACQFGHFDCAYELLKRGADPMIANNNGDNCLHICAYMGYVELVKLLLCYCFPNAQNNFGETALMIACKYNHRKVVKILYGFVNPYITTIVGNNCLHVAVLERHYGVIKKLLKYGMDSGFTNIMNRKAIDIARDCGYEEIMSLF